MLREISAGIIIYRKTEDGPKFLLLYHGRGYWNFPKGKIESEEKSFQAAVRETREETGLNRNDLKFVNNFKVSEKFSFWRRVNEKNVRVFKIVIFYFAETGKREIRISEEHGGYAWFTYKEAIKILLKHKDSQKVLTQAHDLLLKQSFKSR